MPTIYNSNNKVRYYHRGIEDEGFSKAVSLSLFIFILLLLLLLLLLLFICLLLPSSALLLSSSSSSSSSSSKCNAKNIVVFLRVLLFFLAMYSSTTSTDRHAGRQAGCLLDYFPVPFFVHANERASKRARALVL